MNLSNITRDLIKPRRIEFEKGSSKYGKLVVEPLERGIGITVGNSLRRVLLSLLPGSAPFAVRIEGVMHEFSAIPGCVEDVSEIILNIKQLVTKMHDSEVVTLRLDVAGPKEVTAADITGDTRVEIINKDLHIATLNRDGKFSMEIDIKAGRGYVSAESLDKDGVPLGTIQIDSIFSPVRKVNHFVTSSRVGQRTDYDKLTVELWTDGSVDPETAVKSAALILREQFSVFSTVEEEVIPVVREIKEDSKPKWNEHLFRRVEELDLSVRSSNCLENANIKYIGELVRRSEVEMLRTKNFGRKSLGEIKEMLVEMNLSLGMKLDNFPEREELDRMYEQSGSVFS